jgi:hypothetical protein
LHSLTNVGWWNLDCVSHLSVSIHRGQRFFSNYVYRQEKQLLNWAVIVIGWVNAKDRTCQKGINYLTEKSTMLVPDRLQ